MLSCDINGVLLCFKTGPIHQPPPSNTPLLGYSLNPLKNGDLRPAPRIPISCNDDSSPTHDYENLIRPKRPAPPRPPPAQSVYSTIATYHVIQGKTIAPPYPLPA
ncbi:hypothetical protein J6590_100044 [Homalodisca vitripennis]|nr:hypothetical protein J6590_100044 [Homalodisca vitripennis]